MVNCKVCETEVDFSLNYIGGWDAGCMTDIGFVCRKCVKNWLADYLQMVNPFIHLKEEETFKIRRKENE